MNKRIRKKKQKQLEAVAQQLAEAVKAALEEWEQFCEEENRRFARNYIRYIEAVRERQYGIAPVLTPIFDKEDAADE